MSPRHPRSTSLVTVVLAALPAAGLLLPAAATAAGDDGRTSLPTVRVVDDRGDRDSQVVDATRMVVRSAPAPGRRATVSVAVPDGLVAGSEAVFHINTDTDPTPEIAYFGAVSSEFQGYRMKSWTSTGAELPFSCGRLTAALDESRARLAFNPLCINKGVRSFSVSFRLVAPTGEASQDDWLPAPRVFSSRVRAFAA